MSQYAEQIGFAAGTLIATQIGTAGVVTPVKFGILQDAQLDFSADLKALYGQGRYAIALAPGKTKVELKAKFAGIRGTLFNGVYFGGTTTATQTLFADAESQTIGTTTTIATSGSTASGTTLPFASTTGVKVGATVTGTNVAAGSVVVSFVANTSVTLSLAITGTVGSAANIVFGPFITTTNQSTWLTDQGVFYAATGLPLVKVAAGTTAPATGQYAVNAGTYVFAPADVGLGVYISYTYSSASGLMLPIAQQRMGVGPSFGVQLYQPFDGRQALYTLNNCQAAKLSMPLKQDDFQINEIDFQVAADVAGNIGVINTSL